VQIECALSMNPSSQSKIMAVNNRMQVSLDANGILTEVHDQRVANSAPVGIGIEDHFSGTRSRVYDASLLDNLRLAKRSHSLPRIFNSAF
jgi:hypothetical protein